MCWSFLPHVRFLILLTDFELLPKTCNFTICSIFSKSGHVGWCTASPDTILKLDTLVMIQTKFGFHWSSTFRGEDFWKSLRRTTDDGRRRRTPNNSNSSHDSGELKKELEMLIVQEMLYLDIISSHCSQLWTGMATLVMVKCYITVISMRTTDHFVPSCHRNFDR